MFKKGQFLINDAAYETKAKGAQNSYGFASQDDLKEKDKRNNPCRDAAKSSVQEVPRGMFPPVAADHHSVPTTGTLTLGKLHFDLIID